MSINLEELKLNSSPNGNGKAASTRFQEIDNIGEVLKEFVDWLNAKPGINMPCRSSVDEFLHRTDNK